MNPCFGRRTREDLFTQGRPLPTRLIDRHGHLHIVCCPCYHGAVPFIFFQWDGSPVQ